jgi:hypothetical protein
VRIPAGCSAPALDPSLPSLSVAGAATTSPLALAFAQPFYVLPTLDVSPGHLDNEAIHAPHGWGWSYDHTPPYDAAG